MHKKLLVSLFSALCVSSAVYAAAPESFDLPRPEVIGIAFEGGEQKLRDFEAQELVIQLPTCVIRGLKKHSLDNLRRIAVWGKLKHDPKAAAFVGAHVVLHPHYKKVVHEVSCTCSAPGGCCFRLTTVDDAQVFKRGVAESCSTMRKP